MAASCALQLFLLVLGYISPAASFHRTAGLRWGRVHPWDEPKVQQLRVTVIAATSNDDYDLHVPTSDARINERIANPLWPNGVSKEDIDEMVEDILADPSINIPLLPDFLERQIYKTTIRLTVNGAYRLVGCVHGRKLWGHSFSLTRNRCNDDYSRRTRQKSLVHMKTDVDEEVLEEIADQLLANHAINQPLVSDFVERQLYVNCLKIIFRVLNMLAASLQVTVCGHDLTLNLKKSTDRKIWKEVARKAKSSETLIDTSVLSKVVRTNMDLDDSEFDDLPFWKQGQKEFVIQVNTVLYSLILGIVDDLLANTELELMTDRIKFDIRLAPNDDAKLHTGQGGRRRRTKPRKESAGKRQRIVAFLLGTAVGIATGRVLL